MLNYVLRFVCFCLWLFLFIAAIIPTSSGYNTSNVFFLFFSFVWLLLLRVLKKDMAMGRKRR